MVRSKQIDGEKFKSLIIKTYQKSRLNDVCRYVSSSERLINDHLCFQRNQDITRMLKMFSTDVQEQIKFSDFVIKINQKGKEQHRVLLITDVCLYNIMPNDYTKCKQRVDLKDALGITIKNNTSEVVVHFSNEYNYRFKSLKQEIIINLLSKLVVARSKAIDGGKVSKMPIHTKP